MFIAQAVLDHETTILNITQANLYNKTVWQKEYSAKAAYGLKDMLPSSWHALAERMRTDTETFNMFYRYGNMVYVCTSKRAIGNGNWQYLLSLF